MQTKTAPSAGLPAHIVTRHLVQFGTLITEKRAGRALARRLLTGIAGIVLPHRYLTGSVDILLAQRYLKENTGLLLAHRYLTGNMTSIAGTKSSLISESPVDNTSLFGLK